MKTIIVIITIALSISCIEQTLKKQPEKIYYEKSNGLFANFTYITAGKNYNFKEVKALLAKTPRASSYIKRVNTNLAAGIPLYIEGTGMFVWANVATANYTGYSGTRNNNNGLGIFVGSLATQIIGEHLLNKANMHFSNAISVYNYETQFAIPRLQDSVIDTKDKIIFAYNNYYLTQIAH